MVIDVRKLEIELARRSACITSLRDVTSQHTLKKIENGEDIKPKQAGLIASFLGLDVKDLIA